MCRVEYGPEIIAQVVKVEKEAKRLSRLISNKKE